MSRRGTFNPPCYPSPPCMNCEDRKTGCHGSCERYKEFTEQVRKSKTDRMNWLEHHGFYGPKEYASAEKKKNKK